MFVGVCLAVQCPFPSWNVNGDLCKLNAGKDVHLNIAARSPCPTPLADLQERELNNATMNRVLSELQNEVMTFGVNQNMFFETYFMQVFEMAYKQDVDNFVAFQQLMSQDDPPPPPSDTGGFLFGICRTILEFLPYGNYVGSVVPVCTASFLRVP